MDVLARAATALTLLGCGDPGHTSWSDSGTGQASASSGDATQASATAGTDASEGDPDASSSDDGAIKLDLAVPDGGPGSDSGGVPSCTVVDDMDAVPPCDYRAPADSFDPVLEWAWEGDGAEASVAVTPLVANLTDDNGDGEIDLCDVPDIVVVAWTPGAQNQYPGRGHIHVLDGATGQPHFSIEDTWIAETAPALGDIDGDGLVEIVALRNDTGVGPAHLVAFEHDGTPKWTSSFVENRFFFSSISIADVDADGDVEILAPSAVHDHEGNVVVEADLGHAPVAVDMDDDGDLELLSDSWSTVLEHDGSVHHYGDYGPGGAGLAVADLDGDELPEVIYGGRILGHDGTLLYAVDTVEGGWWGKPVAVHDVDADEVPEIVLPGNVTGAHGIVTVVEADGEIAWQVDAQDSGNAGATAFDFLGDGTAEAIYADEVSAYAYGPAGAVEMSVPRSSYTNIEYPVVADVDNDGSAEFIVVSNVMPGQSQTAPPVQVFGDAEDRWVGARRIWNQHAYHVTNVREDGTIPQIQTPPWKHLNTFRTQAQLEAGSVCDPDPEG